ncbi:MAG: hypothetical protein KDA80_09695 [Planctomycetaceae bacterium]|nr:hypothetical protein [Planctomycetaceae bacterium]
MSLPSLPPIDAKLMFSDWGEPATLKQVLSTYDPQSGLHLESVTEFPVTVIKTSVDLAQLGATEAQLPVNTTCFLIQTASIPSGVSLTSARLDDAQRSFAIQHVEDSAISGLTALFAVSDDREATATP